MTGLAARARKLSIKSFMSVLNCIAVVLGKLYVLASFVPCKHSRWQRETLKYEWYMWAQIHSCGEKELKDKTREIEI